MNLLNLAARICNAFSASDLRHMQTVQKVKYGQSRDVVTELDMKLHNISEQFMVQNLPGCKLLSEEGFHLDFHGYEWCKNEWLIIDPLDGSYNYAYGFPNYGYMAAYLQDGKIVGSVIVLPEHDQYLVTQGDQILYAQPIQFSLENEQGTVYYAYPPNQDKSACEARFSLINLIDANSAGMYRYGSACVGLYQLLCGRHMAFIGHGIRFWDAIAFLPILTASHIKVMYAIKGSEMYIVASKYIDFLENAVDIIEIQQGFTMKKFCIDDLEIYVV